jgi:hypothetical protein
MNTLLVNPIAMAKDLLVLNSYPRLKSLNDFPKKIHNVRVTMADRTFFMSKQIPSQTTELWKT